MSTFFIATMIILYAGAIGAAVFRNLQRQRNEQYQAFMRWRQWLRRDS